MALPGGSFNRVYLLAAAEGDQHDALKIDGEPSALVVPDWSQFIGRWDERLWKGAAPELTYDWNNPLAGLVPGYIKRSPVAWYCSHRHDSRQGNEFYQYAYLFMCAADLPAGARQITLPNNEKIRVFAVTVANDPGAGFAAAAPLYDTFADHVEGGAPSASPAPGKFTDFAAVTLLPPLYYREGNLHYTTDGSLPTASSPVYTERLVFSRDTNLRACEFDARGQPGPVWSGSYQVDDVHPPAVVSASSAPLVPEVQVRFSKPVQPASGTEVSRYVFSAGENAPALSLAVVVRSARLSEDGMTVTLHLDAPLPQNAPTTLHVREIVEASPRANVLKSSENSVDGLLPVYTVSSLRSPQASRADEDAKLPVQPGQPWTLNFFLRCDRLPPGYVLLGGFGGAEDRTAKRGTGRYFINYEDGLGFWLANEDLKTHVKLDPQHWQMLTATYDGVTVTLYKDGTKIAAEQRNLPADAAFAGLGLVDPWGRGNKFDGEIRDFKVWTSVLNQEALRALQQSRPAD